MPYFRAFLHAALPVLVGVMEVFAVMEPSLLVEAKGAQWMVTFLS